MLRTYQGNEAAPLSMLFGDDVRLWHSVSFELPTPYFLICHALRQGDVWRRDTCLLWAQTNVLDFCNIVNADPDRKIIQLSILIPSVHTGNWHMEELEEIWGNPAATTFCPLVLIGSGGKVISKISQSAKKISMRKQQRIYVKETLNGNVG